MLSITGKLSNLRSQAIFWKETKQRVKGENWCMCKRAAKIECLRRTRNISHFLKSFASPLCQCFCFCFVIFVFCFTPQYTSNNFQLFKIIKITKQQMTVENHNRRNANVCSNTRHKMIMLENTTFKVIILFCLKAETHTEIL